MVLLPNLWDNRQTSESVEREDDAAVVPITSGIKTNTQILIQVKKGRNVY